MGHPPAETAEESPRCPVCGEGFSRSNLVLCRTCSAPHHRKCWGFNKGCATYACRCRTFVLPPVSAGDGVEFTAKGRPHGGVVTGIIVTFLVGFFASMALAPKAITGYLLSVLIPGYILSMFAATLGVGLLETRTTLEIEAGTLRRERWFGPWRFSDDPAWRHFADVEDLDIRLKAGGAKPPGGDASLVEVWLRDRRGERHLLERAPIGDQALIIEKAEVAAETLDSTLALPREISAGTALPAGLAKALAALPARGLGDGDEAAGIPDASGESPADAAARLAAAPAGPDEPEAG